MLFVGAMVAGCTTASTENLNTDQKAIHTMVDAMEAASQAIPEAETDASVATQQATSDAETDASVAMHNENSGLTIAPSPENGTLVNYAESMTDSADTRDEDRASNPADNTRQAAVQTDATEAIDTNHPAAPAAMQLDPETNDAAHPPTLAAEPAPAHAPPHDSHERAQRQGHASRWWWLLLTFAIPVCVLLRHRRQIPQTPPTRRQQPTITLSPLANQTRLQPLRHTERTVRQRPRTPLAWIYKKPDYDKWPTWRVDDAVDFTPWQNVPVENNSTVPQTTLAPAEAMTPELATPSNTPEVCAMPLADAAMALTPQQAAPPENDSTEPQTTLAITDAMHEECASTHSPSDVRPIALLERIEHLAYASDPTNPAFFIEGREPFPTLIFQPAQAPNPSTLMALEQLLSNASPKDNAVCAWLRTQLSLIQIGTAAKVQLQPLHTQASILIQQHADQASAHEQPYWQSRSIELDLAVAKRQTGAARLLRLRQMQAMLTTVLERNDAPVLRAWIHVLIYWATCQLGDGALEKYTEAEAFCLRLQDMAGQSDDAQLLRAKVLVRRAMVEACSIRSKNLELAQALLQELFERVPSGDIALAIAQTALVRGGDAQQPEQAKHIYSHALMHAFLAESDPRWRAESLQLRLAIQLAYEQVPGSSIHDPIALTLVQTLESAPTPPAETLHRMAQTYLRSSEFARACELCDEASRIYPPSDRLLDTWREASRQWAASLNHPQQHHTWQAAERKRRLVRNAC